MQDVAHFTAEATLRDGRPVTIRAIRPSDREKIQVTFEKLEPRTVFMRFFGRKATLTDRELTDLTEVDFERAVALVVTWVEEGEEQLIAGGRYINLDDSTPSRVAEIAFTVRDDVQGQGLASLILRSLAQIARLQGIGRFEAEVLPRNTAMLSVFRKSGLPMQQRKRDGIVHVTLDLADG